MHCYSFVGNLLLDPEIEKTVQRLRKEVAQYKLQTFAQPELKPPTEIFDSSSDFNLEV